MFGFIQFGKTFPQIAQPDIDRTGDRAQFIFFRFTHVKNDGICGNRIGKDNVAQSGKHIFGNESGKIDRIFRGTVRRRIGKFQFAEFRCFQSAAHRLCNRINALVNALRTRDLRPVNCSVSAEDQFHGETGRARIIGRIRHGIQIDLAVFFAHGFQPFFRVADTGSRQMSDLDNARS